MRKLTTLLLLLVVLIPTAGAQSTDLFKKKKKKKGTTEAVDKAKADSIAKAKKDPLQPYGKVITGKAKTMNGFFKVHNVEGKYYFEIADSLLGRDILIVNRNVKLAIRVTISVMRSSALKLDPIISCLCVRSPTWSIRQIRLVSIRQC